jgi:hypothetical protein
MVTATAMATEMAAAMVMAATATTMAAVAASLAAVWTATVARAKARTNVVALSSLPRPVGPRPRGPADHTRFYWHG